MTTLTDLSLEPKATKIGTLFRIPERDGIPAIKVKEVDYRKGYYLFVDKDNNYYIVDTKYSYYATLKLNKDKVAKLSRHMDIAAANVDVSECWEEQEYSLRVEQYEYQRRIKNNFLIDNKGLVFSTDEEGLPIVTKDATVLFEFSNFIGLDNMYRFYEPQFEDITNIERYGLGVISQRIGNRVVETTSAIRNSKRANIQNGRTKLPFNMIIIGNNSFTEQFITDDPSFVSERAEWVNDNNLEPALKRLGNYLGTPLYSSEMLCNGTIPTSRYTKEHLISKDSDLDDLYNEGFMLGETMFFNPKYKDIRVNFQLDPFNKILYVKRIKLS